MSHVEIRMPQWGMGMTEGTVTRWYRGTGETCVEGEPLLEVESAKTIADVEAPASGVLLSVDVPEGETAKVRTLLATIGTSSGDAPTTPETSTTPSADVTTASPSISAGSSVDAAPPAMANGDQPRHIQVSPIVRRLAARNNVSLYELVGSDPHGRIARADVEEAIAARTTLPSAVGKAAPAERVGVAAPSSPAPAVIPTTPADSSSSSGERVVVSAMRRTVADRLTLSEAVPHFYAAASVEVDALVALRAQIAADRPDVRVSATDLIVRACALALRHHPEVNASWDGDAIVRHGGVHLGLAVALDDGLIVPVIRDADRKSVGQLSAEARDLAERARDRTLRPEECSGSTFTISNLGMFGVEEFTALLNPPEAAILAVGAARKQVVVRDDAMAIRTMMQLTLTVDHRVFDGARAARFLATLTELISRPIGVLI